MWSRLVVCCSLFAPAAADISSLLYEAESLERSKHGKLSPVAQQTATSCGPASIRNMARQCPALHSWGRKKIIEGLYSSYSSSKAGALFNTLTQHEGRRWYDQQHDANGNKRLKINNANAPGSTTYDLQDVLQQILTDSGLSKDLLTCTPALTDISSSLHDQALHILGDANPQIMGQSGDLQELLDQCTMAPLGGWKPVFGPNGGLRGMQAVNNQREAKAWITNKLTGNNKILLFGWNWGMNPSDPNGHWSIATKDNNGAIIVYDPLHADGMTTQEWDTKIRSDPHVGTYIEDLTDNQKIKPETLEDAFARVDGDSPGSYGKGGGWAITNNHCVLTCPDLAD